MAQRFTGIVIVRCNCDHAIAGAPVSIVVSGSRGVEYRAVGTTNACGFRVFEYQRGSSPIDVTTVEGKVEACGQTVDFRSMQIETGVDWKAVIERINATRKLPRGFTLKDLKAQIEYFSFTSLDLVPFSNVQEVTVECHEDCRRSQDDLDHGETVAEDAPVTTVDYRILLPCPSKADETLTGIIWGMGSGSTAAEAQVDAKARARQLAREKVEALQQHYRCGYGCELVVEATYSLKHVGRGHESRAWAESDAYITFAIVEWTLTLRCR